MAAITRTSTRTSSRTAHAVEAALLQHAQQVHLQLGRDVADLVEENRAAVGHLELAALLLAGAGEGAFFVAEQLAFEQRLGQRRAGDRHERLLRAVAGIVDGARDQLLAGAAFALNQHRAAQAGHLLRQLQNVAACARSC